MRPTTRSTGDWLVVDATAGVFVGVIGAVGLASALSSPVYLRLSRSELVRPERGPRLYYGTFLAFWAVLVAVPLAGNLGIAWLLIEATTAASALLVGFSGRASALEAGWKYLVLTTLGLGFALLGIVLIAPNVEGGLGGLSWSSLASLDTASDQLSVAFVLLLAGLAAKIGWAPVHNWLPDAHSEAPPPVSALLSSALLPAVLVVAWRSTQALTPAVGESMARGVLVGFGLVSLAVAVPFLWRALAWKRLLAYSSLEHMGVLALGFAFANPLAMAGVVVHVSGHAIAKALGFYAATPLLGHVPAAGGRAATGVGRTSPALGRRWGSRSGRSPACRRRRSSPARCSSWREASPPEGRGRRLPQPCFSHSASSGSHMHCSRRSPGRHAAAHRDRPRAAHCRRAHRRRLGCPARAHRTRSVAARLRARRGHAGSGVTTYREAVAGALENGWSFAGLYAVAAGGPVRLVLANDDGGLRIETVECVAGAVPSIVDLVPAANWDEREAHDLYGVRFEGHEPLRPLVEHDLDVARWTVPVQGRDPYQVAVGPIHAGVIESGHFRFHLVGEKILHLDARLFYKHRGLERAAEGSSLADGLRYVARACAACAVTNGVAYALAVEEATGLRPSAELARVRTVLLELERVWSHLNDISAVCAGNRPCRRRAAVRGPDRAGATAQRTPHGPPVPVRRSPRRQQRPRPRHGGNRARAGGARRLRVGAASGWRELVFNRSFDDRLLDVGVVRAKEARRLGATGPAARASGMAVDVRAVSPRLAYEGFAPVVPSRTVGDVKSRLEQRHLELVQSFDLLEALLADPIGACAAERGAPERDIAAARVESPRGATLCVVERAADRLTRVHLRTGSYANWPVVAFAAVGNMLPDFPLINKSFELCYACADR